MLNNKTKMFLLLTLIFFTAVGLSAVSAADLDADATDIPVATQEIADDSDFSVDTAQSDLSNKNTQLNKKTVENVKSEGEGTFADLANDIAGSEVTLEKDYVQGELETNVTIAENKVIDANGKSITSHNGTFVINEGVTFTLKNAIIYSQYAPSMSYPLRQAYYYDIDNHGTVLLENVTFHYTGTDLGYGAPVYMYTSSNITVKDSIFEGYVTNQAMIYGYNAGINITVDNSLFTNYNTANAAIYMRTSNSNLTVTNTNFTNAGWEYTTPATSYSGPTTYPTRINYGGALYLNNYQQNAIIENCVFDNITSQYRGAAMYVSGNTTVKDSTFKNLKQTAATYNGGAIWVNNNNGVLCLENNVMEDIVSNSADVYFYAGKINSTVNVVGESLSVNQEDSVVISFNVTDDNGNSIDFRTSPFTVKVDNQEVSSSYGNGTVTAEFYASMEPGVYDITLEYTTTNMLGDVVVTPDLKLTVIDIGLYKYANVTQLIADAKLNGLVEIDSLVVRGSDEESIPIDNYVTVDFKGNTINAKDGKVFDILPGAVVTIKNANIINVGNPSSTANAYNTEGRIANITGGYLTFDNVTFQDCNAPNYGSSASGSFILVLFDDSYVKLNDCTITNCKGTFINLVNGTADIAGTTFENNVYSSANALIANGGILDVTDSQFINNTVNIATIRGQSNALLSSAYGGNHLCFNQPLTITGTLFENNYAGSGRGAAVNTNDDTTITDSVFINNRINQYSNKGGAVFSEEGDLTIDGCVFVNNSARYYVSYYGDITANNGTAIYNQEGNMNIKNSIIVSNVTEAVAVYNDAEDAEVVANGNYWGQAEPNGRYASGDDAEEIIVDNWVVLGITATPMENINYMDNVTVSVGLTKVSDGETLSDVTEALPDYGYVEFTADGGAVEFDTVDVVDGVASDKVTAKYDPVEVIASYLTDGIGITLDVTMPEPSDITLNDGNWTKYFDEETGTINAELVVPDSTLRFDGVFTERDMVIDMPVTITTADNQAILNNCTIMVVSNNVIIKDIQMNSEDYADVLIETVDANDVVIENNTLTITNNEADQITRAIRVAGGEYDIIKDNVINTAGPEVDIIYNPSEYTINTIYTTSIEATACDGLTITGNKIYTTKSDADATDRGTLFGVYVTGEDYDTLVYEVDITNNTIDTFGDAYEYGIKATFAQEINISDNIINSLSEHYANGIETNYLIDSVIANNTIDSSAEDLSTGILLNGFYISRSAWDLDLYDSTGNLIDGNDITLSSDNAWAMELFVGSGNAATNNNIVIDCDYGVGIGIADSSANDISYNTIELTATMEGEPDTMDTISPIPAGVKVQYSGAQMESSEYNAIYENNIVVNAPVETVPAVNTTVRRTEVTDNYLISPKGVGDAAVLATVSQVTIEDNAPKVYTITEETYANFFDEEGVFMPSAAENGSYLNVSGEIFNKDFTFDNVELVIIGDGTAVLYNATITTKNDAKVSFDALVIDNTNKQAVKFESEGNELKNTEITVVSDIALNPVEITGNSNHISNVTITATVPSADVEYGPAPAYPVITPAPAALLITSSNNVVEDIKVTMDGSEALPGWAQTTNGIYILSLGDTIEDNTITNAIVNVNGPNYVYGINVGNAKDTELDGIDVEVMSDYYADALQFFDADTIAVSGNLTAEAGYQAYGIYSTAMGSGISQNIVVNEVEINVDSFVATGIHIEGANNTLITRSIINVEGTNATAVMAYVDWMENIPDNIEVSLCTITVTTDGDLNVLYFGNCTNVYVQGNEIRSTGGSEIFLNIVPGAQVNNNYIMINDVLIGNHAVITTEDDTVIENNTPVNEEYEAMLELLKMYQTSIITIDDIDNAAYRDEVTITGKLNDGMGNLIPDQTLTITIGDLIDTVTTENGLFEYTLVAKQIGLNTVTITYEGTENHNEAEAEATFTVDKKESEITINDIATVTCNDDVKISGLIASIDGIALRHVNVFVYLNGEEQHVTTDTNGVFRATFTTSTVGEQEVSVVYKGNANYLASNATTTFTTSSVKLVMFTVKPVTYRDNYTIQGKLVDAEGNVISDAEVQLTINGETVVLTTDKNGRYTYKAQALELGNFTVTASYTDEETGVELTVTKTLEVTKRETTILLDQIADTQVGSEVTITGTLTDNIGTPYKNCNIFVTVNGEQQHITTNTKGVFTCTYTPTSAGTQNVTVNYKGNVNYLGDKVTTTFEATA